MDIIFYNNLSDPNKIDKNLSYVSTITGTLKESCDILNPQITISNTGMILANYCYIPEFDRYYFIDRQTIISEYNLLLNLTVDVLESFKSAILALSCIIDTTTSDNDKYMAGPEWLTNVKTSTFIQNFPSGLNESGEYILITAGG